MQSRRQVWCRPATRRSWCVSPAPSARQQDVLGINFVAGGRIIRLGDIAQVTRGPADPAQPMFRVNGQQGIGIAIAMRTGGDVMALGHNVAEAMARITENLPVGIEPVLVANQTMTVEHAVDEFMEALWEAIAIVLGVSLLSLGVRAGAVVALSIPLVLAAVFTVMSLTGIDLQRISLGALIIALGLLVDDAMITVELMVTRLERGDDKEQAASFAYTSTAFPMLTGTLVTVAGFVPIGFARSAAGEYTFSIFAVVAIALLASWVVAVVFSPLLGVWILKKPKAVHSEEPGPIMRTFRRFLELAMRWRWITLLVTLGLCALSVLAMRFVPQQFFPSSDRPELLVDLQLPENASIYATRDVSARFDALLKGDADVDHWSTYVGRGAVRFYLPLNVQLPNDFFAQAVVVTKGLEQRERVKAKLEKALANEFPSVIGRVYPLELGPPVGWPLQYRVSGPEPAEVRAIAFKVAGILGDDPDAWNVHYNWMEPARTVRIRVDQDQARLLGLSSQDLAQSLNTVVSGVTATELRSGIHLVDVVVRASAEQRMSPSTIRTLQVPLPNGKTVPLGQIASVEYGQEFPIVWRRDRRPTVTVQADVVAGMQAATVVQALAPKIEALNASLPYGYRIDLGGTVEESDKGQVSVAAVVPLMLVLMLTVLMIQLQSFSRLFLVLSVAPLGLIGVVAALLIADKPLGFVALLGVLALIGMIARNSVILIDQIEQREGAGTRCLGSRHRGHHAPLPPDPAHRGGGDPRHDPHRTDDLLGSHGLRHHGWARGRDRPHPRLPAGALRDLVSRRAAAGAARIGAGANMSVDATAILSQVSGLLGALIGGGASLAVAVYNQRCRGTHAAGGQRGHQAGDDLCRFPGERIEDAAERLYARRDRAGRRRAASDRADQPDEALRAASHRWRGGRRAQSHRRDPAEAQYRAAPAGARVVVQESRSRSLSEVQPELPGRPGPCAPHLKVKLPMPMKHNRKTCSKTGFLRPIPPACCLSLGLAPPAQWPSLHYPRPVARDTPNRDACLVHTSWQRPSLPQLPFYHRFH